MSTPTLPDVLAVLRAFLAAQLPGAVPEEIVIKMRHGPAFRSPIPLGSGTAASTAGGPVTPVPSSSYEASADLRCLDWYGHVYTFSATQAACIRVLLEAYESGTPDVGQAAILERAGSDSERLRDLFRSGKGAGAWGVLIVPGESQGSFRLADPVQVG